MLEANLEQVFFRSVRDHGGIAIKLAPTHAGIPDRLVLWPNGISALVELKTSTGTVSKIQRLWHARAAELGHSVVVLRGRTQIDSWIAENGVRSLL